MKCEKSELEILEKDLVEALDELYERDKYLILNRSKPYKYDNHVSERGIVFRLGIYLQRRLDIDFPEYDLDAEYNRNLYEQKNFSDDGRGKYPDLIVHQRGSNERNLLIAEFKTWWNSNTTDDENKVKKFMDPKGIYKYKYGVVIVLEKEKPKMMWIK